MDQNLVKKLVNEAISDNESLFLIELSFLVGNRIKVVVDGDQGHHGHPRRRRRGTPGPGYRPARRKCDLGGE